MINYANLTKAFVQLREEREPSEDLRNARFKRHLQEAFTAGAVRATEFDFGKLFVECFGWNEFHHCRSTGRLVTEVMEAAGAVSTSAFTQIGGQVIYQMIMEKYNSPEYIFSRIIPTRDSNFSFEKIAGITELGDEVGEVIEGDDYPIAGVGESYMHLPETKKRGFKVLLTREAIFFDRTGVLQDRCRDGAKWMAVNREKRAVDAIIDENAGAKSAAQGGHRYHYKGNSIATYGNSSGNHDWDNLEATNALVDWTDIDLANQLLQAMTDPDTGEPIVFMPKHLVAPHGLGMTANRIKNATEITVATPGFATTGNPSQTKVTGNVVGPFEVLSSPYVAARQATDTSWYWGDLTAAFVYVQNWAPEVKTLAGGTQLEFDRDIVQQYRFSEYGNYGTKEPRAMVKSTVA